MTAPAVGERARLDDLLAPIVAPDVSVDGIALDSREVRPGFAFLACRGVSGAHGLDYLDQALRQGATAVVYEPDGRPVPRVPAGVASVAVPALGAEVGRIADRYFGAPSAALRVVGVTGTNGKTTVAWLLAVAAERLAMPTVLLGTLGAGRPDKLVAGALTTPDALAIHRFLASARKHHAQLDGVAMEVSSHALDQGRVNGVRFDAGVFTNLSRDHLDYHADMSAYAAAKERLFAEHRPRLAVVNVDDEVGRDFAAGTAGEAERLYTVGTQDPPRRRAHGRHLKIEAITQTAAGLLVDLGGELADTRLALPMIGRFNAYNALQVLAVLLDRGIDIEAAIAALGKCSAPPGRMQRVGTDSRSPMVIIDYAHTPDSLREALSTLREHARGEVFCVFGCGGDRDRGKRPLMAQAAERGADRIIVTDDNPRTEDPGQIVEDIRRGFEHDLRPQVIHDRREAIRVAVREASPGDVVLVAGKGHEDYQLRGGERLDFSDYDEAVAALQEECA